MAIELHLELASESGTMSTCCWFCMQENAGVAESRRRVGRFQKAAKAEQYVNKIRFPAERV